MRRGTPTSVIEVTNVSRHGFWILLGDRELHVPFATFPWFRDAPIAKLTRVQLLSGDHLYWPSLDIDLSIESIEHPERFPLVSKFEASRPSRGARRAPSGVRLRSRR